MKTRILSLVLAIVMVLSMAAVFSIASSADEAAEGLTVTVGTTYAVPGTTAWVDVYVSAKSIPAGWHHLRNWQFDFEGAAGVGERDCYASAGDKFGFFNENTNTYGFTVDTGYDAGMPEQILALGGWKIASLSFAVPADATGTIAVSVSNVTALGFEEDDYKTPIAVDTDSVALVAGKIVVVPGISAASEYPDDPTGDFVIPTVNAAGERINSVYNESEDDIAVAGEYGTFIIPACITVGIDDLFDAIEFEELVLKSTAITDAQATTIAKLGSNSDPVQVYIHKRANGGGTTAAAFDSLSNLNKKKVNVMNILASYENTVKVDGNVVSFVGGIVPKADLDYSKFVLEAKFVQGENVKVISKETKKIFKTVTGLASTVETTASAQSSEYVVGSYIAGLKINGVPAGDYTATFTFYGVTPDVNGNPIYVCSDPVVADITVG